MAHQSAFWSHGVERNPQRRQIKAKFKTLDAVVSTEVRLGC
jgi:hypothetical protein